MSTQGFDPSARGGLPAVPRRSFLQFGATGLALGAVSAHGTNNQRGDQPQHTGIDRWTATSTGDRELRRHD